jgi:hypothetical protein
MPVALVEVAEGVVMRLVAALVGDLEQMMREETEIGARAVTLGTRQAVDALKGALRAQTVSAFGSQRLALTWRGESYPKGADYSLGAAGVVFSKAPHIVEAFNLAAPIRSRNGFWLAIPSPDAMKMRGPRGQRPTPASIEARLGVALQFVYRPGKSALLVANLRRRTGQRGGFAKPSATAITKGTVEGVVLFYLVPVVQLRKRFDLDASYDRALDDMVRNIVTEWQKK